MMDRGKSLITVFINSMSQLVLLNCLEEVIFMFFFVSRATPPPDLRKEWVLESLVKL